jgi:L-rhamnose isomerase
MKVKAYEALGVDVVKSVEAALAVPISMHCWQADDVAGLESGGAAADSGAIKSTGNYPGKARNGDEMRMDFENAKKSYAEAVKLNPGLKGAADANTVKMP